MQHQELQPPVIWIKQEGICPWCGAPKLQSQTIQIFFYIWGFIGLCLGGGIGYLAVGDEGAFGGGMIGGHILGVIGYISRR